MLESLYDNNMIHSFSGDEHTEASDGDTFSIVIKRVSCCFIQDRHPQFSALETIASLGTESTSRSATDSLGQKACVGNWNGTPQRGPAGTANKTCTGATNIQFFW